MNVRYRKDKTMKTFQQHPLSAAFPAMAEDEYKSLKESIASIGLQNSITLYEGMVLDGWHRYQACVDVSRECAYEELGEVDPREFVLAQNKSRRQINKSQLAMAVACVYEWKPTAGRPNNTAPGAVLNKTAPQMAAIAGVGLRTMEQAKLVESKASPEVKQAVKVGTMSVSKAAETINPPTPKTPPPTPASAPAPADDQQAAPQHEYSELDAAHDQIKGLQDELAVACMCSTNDDEREQAANMVADLRQQIKTLEATLKAVKLSRDTAFSENAELRKQVLRQRREISKLTSKGVA